MRNRLIRLASALAICALAQVGLRAQAQSAAASDLARLVHGAAPPPQAAIPRLPTNPFAPAPVSTDPDVIAHGAQLYAKICSVCHGAQGEGYKADQATAIG